MPTHIIVTQTEPLVFNFVGHGLGLMPDTSCSYERPFKPSNGDLIFVGQIAMDLVAICFQVKAVEGVVLGATQGQEQVWVKLGPNYPFVTTSQSLLASFIERLELPPKTVHICKHTYQRDDLIAKLQQSLVAPSPGQS